MSDYEVRPATMRDAKAVAEVHALAAKAAYEGILPEDELRALAPASREAKWREAIEFSEPQVQVAVHEGQVVGFVGFDRSRDPKTPSTTGEIWAIYVLPEHWGKGVGVALWDAAREGLEEEGCTTVTIWVPIRNDRAMRFHELAGFKREMKTAKTTAIGTVRIEEIRLKRNVA
ncbi:GNAT superfamily N-acetyltransferase [Variovorax sp. TBS-050B]|jgi:GNAT superfamily N-acetyltransferase|uniref:GNAT family N-acetyltransferase n=1 Tax=Variovorax sp. TBS-050B TaxID=2940551 RepID=UPI002474659C|nr:GNAT family N-acetyltransferase [Variovorax sp. TBS-050B]MDH6593591.1 GNAT superfamily N-acetyltransferase [Variovorax sp. TBS-050B]